MLERRESLIDTIVACATPPGEGAIAVVRLSGGRARQIAAQLTPERKSTSSHRLVRTVIRDAGGQILDDAMVVEMHGPRSYTGEDVVEMHVHGSRSIVAVLLETCERLGARLAGPGEFTLRAFLNGRMDLAQAEAVGDLIAAKNRVQRQVAAAHLQGGLSRQVEDLQRRLEHVLADWRAALDFPEYPTGEGLIQEHHRILQQVRTGIEHLLQNVRRDVTQGRKVVLCGAPNVGKSTLLNAWAGETRVLVDAAPGTTRDPVEVELTQGLVRWSVWDTAGIRREAEGLEARGIEMALARARQADVVLWLLAADRPEWPPADLSTLVIGSKSDLIDEANKERLTQEAHQRGLSFLGWVSAHTGEGIEELRRRLAGFLEGTPIAEDQIIVVRQRHVEALRQAHEALDRLLLGLEDDGLTLDVLATELEEAAKALGAILGRDVDEAVLDRIFSQFCIGK